MAEEIKRQTYVPLFVYEQELHQGTNQQELIQIAEYYFDGQGKALRPMVTMLMGKAINYHMHRENRFVLLLDLFNLIA